MTYISHMTFEGKQMTQANTAQPDKAPFSDGSEFTPVPWEHSAGGSGYFGGHSFCRPDGSGFTATCTADEARLIAASPAMFDVLETAKRLDAAAKRGKADGRVFIDYRDWEAFMAEVRAALSPRSARHG